MESLIGTLMIFLLIGLFASYKIKKKKEKLFDGIPTHLFTISGLAFIFAFSFGIIFTPIVFGLLKLGSTHSDDGLQELFVQFKIIQFLLLCFVAPICEELFFRRYLFQSIRAKRGALIGYLVTVIPFALLHISPPNIIHALFMGTFFTYLYYRTESIVVAIIAHAVNNLIPTFGPYLQMKIPLFFIEFNTPWRYLEFAIAIGLLLWSLRRIHQITRPQELELPLEGS